MESNQKDQNQNVFKYTYSAKQQEEINKIRKKYIAPEEDKMEQLRKLDHSVTRKAGTVSITVGMIGALVLGAGMSLTMTDLGKIFDVGSSMAMFLGIVIGTAGIVLVCCAYPIYNRIVKQERKKIAPEII
ncbi:MAG: hypothetical protein K2O40_15145, partial [Lachnospiraceae bacterium]|nr:hypothetical protein [Lachnospiraceae bacterium]